MKQCECLNNVYLCRMMVCIRMYILTGCNIKPLYIEIYSLTKCVRLMRHCLDNHRSNYMIYGAGFVILNLLLVYKIVCNPDSVKA